MNIAHGEKRARDVWSCMNRKRSSTYKFQKLPTYKFQNTKNKQTDNVTQANQIETIHFS